MHGYLIIQVDVQVMDLRNIADSSTWGYWTSTAYTGTSVSMWGVNRCGFLSGSIANETVIGLRQVITISKSVIS